MSEYFAMGFLFGFALGAVLAFFYFAFVCSPSRRRRGGDVIYLRRRR